MAASHLACLHLCSRVSVFSASVRGRAPACAHLCRWTCWRVRLHGVGAPACPCVYILPAPARSFFETDTLPPSAQTHSKFPPAGAEPGATGAAGVPTPEPFPPLPLPSAFPSRGAECVGTSQKRPPGQGKEETQLDWGPRAEEGCSQLVTSGELPRMAPGAPVPKGTATSEPPTPQKSTKQPTLNTLSSVGTQPSPLPIRPPKPMQAHALTNTLTHTSIVDRSAHWLLAIEASLLYIQGPISSL